jgi:hypothetical protein
MMLPLFCAQEHAMTITVLFGFRTADKHISKPCMYLHGNAKLGMHTPSVKKKGWLYPCLGCCLACRLIVKSEHPVDFSAKAGTCCGELCNQRLRGSADHYIFHFWHGLQLCSAPRQMLLFWALVDSFPELGMGQNPGT